MRYFVITILLINSLGCVADPNVIFLSKDELESSSSAPDNESIKVDMMRKLILESNFHNGEIVDYYYGCDNLKTMEPKTFFVSSQSMAQYLKTMEPKTFFVSSQSMAQSSGVYDVFDWGVISETTCKSTVNFNDLSMNELWLQSCAQASVLSLISNMEDRHEVDKKIDYAQWCILKSDKGQMTIKQLVKFR